MRVRVIKGFSAAGRTYIVGEVLEVNPAKVDKLLNAGLVMQDKSMDGAEETKSQKVK